MSGARCPWSWQVEAARDERLEPGLRAEYERHLHGCARCSEERRALETMAQMLRAEASGPDEVALRRMRQSLLGEASRLMQAQRSAAPPRFGPGTAGAASALLRSALSAAAVFALGLGAARWFAAEQARSPLIEARPQAGAKWSRHSARGLERVDLMDGELRVRVRRRANDPRVVVRVPDGEIEDLGTVFRVRVHEQRTREIAVSEGRVVFRRPGQAALRLSAGMQWTRVEAARADNAPSAAPVPVANQARAGSAIVSSSTARPGSPVRLRARAPDRNASANPKLNPVLEPADAADPRDPSRRALPQPAAALEGAATAAPEGAAEDAAYLQILALLRENRREEARVAAAVYLQKYPNGFRRVEVERVAWPAKQR